MTGPDEPTSTDPAPVLRPAASPADTDVTREVTAFLTRDGWAPGTPGVAGALWRHPRADHALAVPSEVRHGSRDWGRLLDRLSTWLQLPVSTIAGRIVFQYTDVTRFRAAKDVVIADTIPLSAGKAMVSTAEAMLRAAATTSIRLRGSIAGNYSRIGDDLVSQARMGHTEHGSYIVPVLMPLHPPANPEQPPLGEGGESEVAAGGYEPAERRVTRTLAEALSALHDTVLAPGREVRTSSLHRFVDAGGSRELVTALSAVLSQESVAQLDTTFTWAEAVPAPELLPTSIEIVASRDVRDLLAQTARQLKGMRTATAQVLTGPVVLIRHSPGDPLAEIAIQTVRSGRPAQVHVRIREGQLADAHEWMQTQRTVLVEGSLRPRTQPLMVDEPIRLLPLDEAMLPGTGE